MKRTSHSWLTEPKKVLRSAPKIQFTGVSVIAVAKVSNASC